MRLCTQGREPIWLSGYSGDVVGTLFLQSSRIIEEMRLSPWVFAVCENGGVIEIGGGERNEVAAIFKMESPNHRLH